MEKLKEFMSSPKKTAILGLIGIAIMLISVLRYTIGEDFFEFGIIALCHTYIYGLVIYFIIILTRIFKQKGNIKMANYLLILSLVIAVIGNCLLQKSLINVIVLIFSLLYLIRILLRKNNFVNNKVISVIAILYIIYAFIVKRSIFVFEKDILDYLTQAIGLVMITPYFYQYFEFLKEENKNGK